MSEPGEGGNTAGQAAKAAGRKARSAAVKAMAKKVGTAVFIKLGGWVLLIVVIVMVIIFMLVGYLVQPAAAALNGDCAAGGSYKPNPPGVYGPNPTVINVLLQVAKQKNADARVTLALFEAAAAESGYRNLASQKIPGSTSTKLGYDKYAAGEDAPPGDHMSVGVLQQQVGMGWGTLEQIMDPAHAAGIFVDRAKAVEARTGGDAANLAQAVQASAFSDGSNYRSQQSDAQAKLTQAQSGNTGATGVSAGGLTCGSGGTLLVTNGFVNFTSHEKDGSSTKFHMAVPVGEAGKAMLAAVTQIDMGWPYSWGGGTIHGASLGIAQGANTKGFDCSGLMLYSVYKGTNGRLQLPRTAADQAAAIKPVSVGAIAPGDLLFYDSPIGHVVMYIGKFKQVNGVWTSTNDNTGTAMVAEAPHTGALIHVRPLADWTPSQAGHPAYQGTVKA